MVEGSTLKKNEAQTETEAKKKKKKQVPNRKRRARVVLEQITADERVKKNQTDATAKLQTQQAAAHNHAAHRCD